MTEKQDEPEVVTSKEVAPIADTPPAVVPSNPMEMIGVAVAAGAPIEKLEALMALQERWEAGEARKAFAKAMTAFKKEPPLLSKNASVSFTNKAGTLTEYDHATLDQVSTGIGEALGKHGLSHRWDVTHLDNGIIEVTCVLMHRAGHSERVSLRSGADKSGGKNDIQALGSTVTYLQRYSLLAATGMAVAGMDNDGMVDEEAISLDMVRELEGLLEEVGADKIAFVKYLGVNSLAQLSYRDYGKAINGINAKRKQAETDSEGS